MVGGNYYTWFKDEGAEPRKILYQLENLGIAKIDRKKLKDKGWYEYNWVLTKKGETLVEKDKNLKKLWNEGKVIEFYNILKEILEDKHV